MDLLPLEHGNLRYKFGLRSLRVHTATLERCAGWVCISLPVGPPAGHPKYILPRVPRLRSGFVFRPITHGVSHGHRDLRHIPARTCEPTVSSAPRHGHIKFYAFSRPTSHNLSVSVTPQPATPFRQRRQVLSCQVRNLLCLLCSRCPRPPLWSVTKHTIYSAKLIYKLIG
jgi:hypothetical protein